MIPVLNSIFSSSISIVVLFSGNITILNFCRSLQSYLSTEYPIYIVPTSSKSISLLLRLLFYFTRVSAFEQVLLITHQDIQLYYNRHEIDRLVLSNFPTSSLVSSRTKYRSSQLKWIVVTKGGVYYSVEA